MRGSAFRYLVWMLLDRTGPRLLASLLIVVAMCFSVRLAAGDDPNLPGQLDQIVRGLYMQLAVIAVVVLFHGIVAEDRTKGYYRFYLAKPVSPLWFYGQSAALAAMAMLVYTAGYLAVFALLVGPTWKWELMVTGTALGLFIGGMMFALSTVTPRDWVWTILVVAMASILRTAFPRQSSSFGAFLYAVLPPNHLVDETSLTGGQWAWLLAWSLGMYTLGLWVLRRRPLAED